MAGLLRRSARRAKGRGVNNTLIIAAVTFTNGIMFACFQAWRKAQIKKGEAGETRVRRVVWCYGTACAAFIVLAFVMASLEG